jgi:hypothetical protein
VHVGTTQQEEEGPDVAGEAGATPLRAADAASRAMTGRGGAGGSDLEQAIGVLRARVDEEFRIAERLDSKQRQAFALAAAFFAVVQTVTFGSFAQDVVTSTERALLGLLALVAGIAVATTAHRLAGGEALLDEDDVNPEAVVRWCNEAAEEHYVARKIVSTLSTVAANRHESNKARGAKVDRVQLAARWALMLTGVELVVAIVTRI